MARAFIKDCVKITSGIVIHELSILAFKCFGNLNFDPPQQPSNATTDKAGVIVNEETEIPKDLEKNAKANSMNTDVDKKSGPRKIKEQQSEDDTSAAMDTSNMNKTNYKAPIIGNTEKGVSNNSDRSHSNICHNKSRKVKAKYKKRDSCIRHGKQENTFTIGKPVTWLFIIAVVLQTSSVSSQPTRHNINIPTSDQDHLFEQLLRGRGRAFRDDSQSNDALRGVPSNMIRTQTASVLHAAQSNIPTSDQDHPSEQLLSERSIISSPESDINEESEQGGWLVERRWSIDPRAFNDEDQV